MPNQLLYQIRRALFEPVSGFRSYCKGLGLQSAFRKLRVHDATLFADGLRSFDAPPAKDVTPAPKDIPRGGKALHGARHPLPHLCERMPHSGQKMPHPRQKISPRGKSFAWVATSFAAPLRKDAAPRATFGALASILLHAARAHDRYARVGTGRLYRLGGLRYLRDER